MPINQKQMKYIYPELAAVRLPAEELKMWRAAKDPFTLGTFKPAERYVPLNSLEVIILGRIMASRRCVFQLCFGWGAVYGKKV